MSDLWAAIDTRRHLPRILVTNAGKEPLLKAHLSCHPQHQRALSTFLEALALWEGRPVRAALVVGERVGCEMSQYHDFFAEPDRTSMYSIEYVSSLAVLRRAHRDQIRGMGRFHDLQQVLRFEVAR
jgi:hypothetical protein